MSHISTIELEIRELDTLQRACKYMDLEFLSGRTQFRHYNGLSPCEHAIRVPDAEYEVGVVKTENGYTLQWDDWQAGGLEQRLGKQAGKLKQAYAVERVKSEARRKGMRVRTVQKSHGVQLMLSPR